MGNADVLGAVGAGSSTSGLDGLKRGFLPSPPDGEVSRKTRKISGERANRSAQSSQSVSRCGSQILKTATSEKYGTIRFGGADA
jgi:hypothetical protein